MTWLASVVSMIVTKLIEKLAVLLASWVKRIAVKNSDEKKTAEVLEEVKNAQTEEERIAAARANANNSGRL